MYKLKDYPDDFWKSGSKYWRKFKKKMKRKTNKAIRRNVFMYKKYNGIEIAW